MGTGRSQSKIAMPSDLRRRAPGFIVNVPESAGGPWEPGVMQEAESKISIVIADDHPIMRDGLKRVLGSQPGIVIAGEATTGAEAIKVARELNPDVLLLDL